MTGGSSKWLKTEVYPIFFFVGLSCTWAGYTMSKFIFQHPDVVIRDKQNNPLRKSLILIFVSAILCCFGQNPACNVNENQRVDCLKFDQPSCEAEGCCWKPTSTGGPAWCYFPTATPPPVPSGVPVFVMMPLNIISSSNSSRLADPTTLKSWLTKVKQSGAHGVMCDFWWGIVEERPQQYNWLAYIELIQMVTSLGLKMNVVASFHRCGGNVGDDCNIPIPSWVRSVSGVYYKDQYGSETQEYITHAADNLRLFSGRTPVEIYGDFLNSFAQTFSSYLKSGWVMEIEVGTGPSGELRYPAYRLDKWSFPGIGAFQCYDQYMLASLKDAANNLSRPEWGVPPTNAGGYNSKPEETGFFSTSGSNNFKSDYGKFFIDWYTSSLIQHGERVLLVAEKYLQQYPVSLSIKISGVHWQYNTESHAAEVTAGYNNVAANGKNGYKDLANMFAKIGISFDFTCLEMRNSEQPADARSNPEALVAQTRSAAESAKIIYRGENALQRYDYNAYDQIVRQSKFSNGEPINGFTYLRLTNELVNNNNYYQEFARFVDRMHYL